MGTMLSLLPDLAPRDSHSLWYTSSRNPVPSSHPNDATTPTAAQLNGYESSPAGGHPGANHRRSAHLIERSPLARLRTDEQNLDRRRQNVTNFGSIWLKPPGIPKTLHQLREERREAIEHQEALRREQLALELAEAEAAGAAGGVVDAALEPHVAGEDGMDDVQLDGARDLDEDIPEAEAADFDRDDDDDNEDEGNGEDEDEEEQHAEEVARAQQQQLMAQRMRQADDAFRENVARGRDSSGFYGVDDEIDDEDQAQMIEEEDLVGHRGVGDMDMHADLDDEIPEAESGGYEHTDTEAELSSSEGDDIDHAEMSFAAQASQSNRLRGSLARSDATRNSITISDLLSRDGSSVLGSSPQVPRQLIGPLHRGR